ncbi:MAG: glycerate kinase [Thermoproteota archaeon]|nr:MAG: glycerate kinase [Candidatus Korarchaeota archaeon]
MNIIKNHSEIISNASGMERKAREIMLELLESAIETVDGKKSVISSISLKDECFSVEDLEIPLKGKVLVIGAGKASGKMAEGVEYVLLDHIHAGHVNVLSGTEGLFNLSKVRTFPAGHPIPDHNTLEGTRKIVELVRGLDESDVVITLISGGGSALMEMPMPGITLEDLNRATRLLLECGARIQEINSVRKHISQVKGGRLARLCYPATVISLIISDVIGDPLDSIASGPTAPDTTTFQDAWEVLEKYDLLKKMPKSIVETLKKGVRGEIHDTPKPGDPVFERVHNFIVANNEKALYAAANQAKALGLNTLVLGSFIEGEARHVGQALAGIAQGIKHQNVPISPPAVVLAGGETTVRVVGSGKGGRNQEVVLGSVEKIADEEGLCIASVGTDGVDGVTDAAGAIADGKTLSRALSLGLKPSTFLNRNDSYSFFLALNDLIFTGPTLTNVMDVMGVVVL